MARAITMKKDVPAYAAEVIERVERLGFAWKLIEAQNLATEDHRVQVRDTEHLAPPREVAQYAQMLRHGDQMPPVIMTADKWLVDGNTRTEAARKIGWDTFPAVVIDASYDKAPAALIRQIKKLGTAFNNTHGRGMTATELAGLIEQIAAEDDRPRDLARELHLPDAMVNTVINAVKARRRAADLDVEILPGVLSNSHLKLFGGKSDKYTGPVFGELLSLVQDARLSNPQTVDLMKRVDEVDTESGRMALLRRERLQYRDVIDLYKKNLEAPRQSPSKAGMLRRTLGFVLKHDADVLVELDSNQSGPHMQVIDEAIDKLMKVKAEQSQVNSARR